MLSLRDLPKDLRLEARGAGVTSPMPRPNLEPWNKDKDPLPAWEKTLVLPDRGAAWRDERRGGLQVNLTVRGPHSRKHKVGKGHPGPECSLGHLQLRVQRRPQPQPTRTGTGTAQARVREARAGGGVVSNTGWFSESLCFHIIL